MLVGLSTLVTVGRLYSPRLFVLHLAQLEGRGFNLGLVRYQLVSGFESAWSQGAFWSVVVGGSAAGGLSYLVSRRIVQPLLQMETITQKFAAGNLQERMAANEIPELDRLAVSFNRMAAALGDVEQRRRQLVGDLTHELRTPLTVVEGYLEGLADGTIEPSTDIYQRLARETARLRRLVNDLQELSKAEAGYLPIYTQAVAIPPLLAALIQQFSEQLLEPEPIFYLECAANLPPALADPERLQQVLVNLVGNALQHTRRGSITLRAWSTDQQLWIAVIDTGEGISPEDLPHVFERFWRASRSRDRDGTSGYTTGTGIGLAISQRLVELQGGRIVAESQLHQGSTFRFWLPLA